MIWRIPSAVIVEHRPRRRRAGLLTRRWARGAREGELMFGAALKGVTSTLIPVWATYVLRLPPSNGLYIMTKINQKTY